MKVRKTGTDRKKDVPRARKLKSGIELCGR